MSNKIKAQKTISIDFDRVVHKYSRSFYNGKPYDVPVEGAIEAILTLQSKGFEVIILTAKTSLGEKRNKLIRAWFRKYRVKVKVTNIKPPAIAYIDDRAIRFTNWRDMLNYFL